MQKRKVSFTFKREKFFTLETQERIYPIASACSSIRPPFDGAKVFRLDEKISTEEAA